MRYWIVGFIVLLVVGFVQAQDSTNRFYEIAQNLIEEASRENSTTLRLTSMSLTDLPPELGDLVDLKYLYLYLNSLSSLPPEIGDLSNLEFLHLGGNQLTQLPETIGHLSQLTTLHLNSNQLSELPAEIGNLENLRLLNLYDNQLGSLPTEIGDLTHLCILNLQNNQFRHLPAELSQLDGLRQEGCGLQVDGNPLISPPQDVIDQGTEAILDYLDNQAMWHLRRLIGGLASGVGIIVAMMLGLLVRRRRGMRKAKVKRGDIL